MRNSTDNDNSKIDLDSTNLDLVGMSGVYNNDNPSELTTYKQFVLSRGRLINFYQNF